ncbi:hypothetical protein MJ904_16575 [Massilia sp. MB5]|uniref:VIT domain-containing protein n=1 Tax=Massilia sp. MB5 TaxID=2919578 RepID=UPI001F0E8A2D|nr:VIT domain-containing protein [Massilia sp. MB5]UMR28742.1 hypothetical protein MJ904_16575 [Massilia sp. MB5]
MLLLLAAQAQAQIARWPLMRVPEASEPVRLQSLAIRGAVSGSMAETTVRMVFFNPNLRQLEGTLEFPLAEGQQLTGFSLDIEGALRPAVPVEKNAGARFWRPRSVAASIRACWSRPRAISSACACIRFRPAAAARWSCAMSKR